MFDLSAALFPESAPPRLRPGPLAPLQQSALYARAVRLVGGRSQYLSLPGTGAWVIARKAPVLGTVGLISRGPADLSIASAQALYRASQSRHLIVNAEDDASADALDAAGFWRIGRARSIAELPLASSTEAMAARLTAKFRNRLRFAHKQDLYVKRTVLPANPRHWIFAAEAEAAKRLRYRPVPPVIVAAMAAATPGAAQLFVARTLSGPVAAMVFLRHGRAATYQIGWSNEAGRTACAGNLLMWRAMVDLQSMGADRLDLGAADPRATPGLAHFKRGTGATIRRLGGTWMCSAALPNRRAKPLRRDRAAAVERLARAAAGDDHVAPHAPDRARSPWPVNT